MALKQKLVKHVPLRALHLRGLKMKSSCLFVILHKLIEHRQMGTREARG